MRSQDITGSWMTTADHSSRPRWKTGLYRAVPSALLLAALFVVAVHLGTQTLDAFFHQGASHTHDPYVIAIRSLRVAETGDIYTRDPPLRYVPLAALYVLFDITTRQAAGWVANLYTALITFVVLPATIGALAASVKDWRAATLSILGFAVWHLVGVSRTAYYDGWWEYMFALPLVFGALLAIDRALRCGRTRSLFWAGVGGTLIGLLGLNQYVLVLIAVAIVTVALLRKRRVVEWVVTGTSAAAFVPVLLLAPPLTVSSTQSKAVWFLGLSKPYSIDLVLRGFVDLVTVPGYLFIVGLLVLVAVGAILSDAPLSETGVLEAGLWVAGGLWLVTTVLVHPRWVSMLAQYVTQYLALVAIVILGIQVLDQRAYMDWHGLNAVLFGTERRAAIVWFVIAVVLTPVLWVVVPLFAYKTF